MENIIQTMEVDAYYPIDWLTNDSQLDDIHIAGLQVKQIKKI